MHEPRYATTTTVVETTEYMTPRDSSPTYEIGVPAADCSYIRTLGGIMKCVCIALCLLCFLCVLIGGPGYYTGELQSPEHLSWLMRERITLLEKGAGWATFVSSVGLCVSTTLLFLYVFRVVDALPQVPWIVGEMCFYFAWTIFFFIAASVLAVAAARFTATGGWAVAAVATGSGRDFIAEQRQRRAQHV
ncbi:synaptophysin / synaptoporin [Ancylostoma caninum]|uniref:Synaptophysin / synaptoporin n=1 Tax=Ancylostoma caninum TaxID=29170 RepID=A0A368GKE0_ANCCA|nr:synaptophysin / synaptoporin [Ancylostoma caninum]